MCTRQTTDLIGNHSEQRQHGIKRKTHTTNNTSYITTTITAHGVVNTSYLPQYRRRIRKSCYFFLLFSSLICSISISVPITIVGDSYCSGLIATTIE